MQPTAPGVMLTMSVRGAPPGCRSCHEHRGFDLVSDALPFGALWYDEPNAISNAVGYAKFFSRSHDAVIHVYDEAGNVIDTHEHAGEFRDL